MTRDEFTAVVETVLDAPRTVPGRAETIISAADAYAAQPPLPVLSQHGRIVGQVTIAEALGITDDVDSPGRMP